MRYTLTYKSSHGVKITLYNLLKRAVDEIISVQYNLGSYDFTYDPQPRNFDQAEIDILRWKDDSTPLISLVK